LLHVDRKEWQSQNQSDHDHFFEIKVEKIQMSPTYELRR
jgi:hypothetical protein